MRYILTLLAFLILIGCGSSSEPTDVSYKSTFIVFNARNVSNDMKIQIEYNNINDYNKTIRYSKQDSHEIWWYEDDDITIKYAQDDNLATSFPIIQKLKGKYLICSLGNSKNSTLPLAIPPIDAKDIHEQKAYIKIINAINDGIEKRVYINYESDKSDFTSFNNISEKFYIDAASNSLVYLQYKNQDTPFMFDDSINFDAKHTYFIIIYEKRNSPDKPQIAIVDMTP